jgi:hypothetical protein
MLKAPFNDDPRPSLLANADAEARKACIQMQPFGQVPDAEIGESWHGFGTQFARAVVRRAAMMCDKSAYKIKRFLGKWAAMKRGEEARIQLGRLVTGAQTS